MKKVVMNIYVQVFCRHVFVSLRQYLEIKLLGQKVSV